MKKLLAITALLLSAIVSSCVVEQIPKGDFTRIEDLYGTEWVYKGEGTLGLKFYSGYQVTSFLDNSYGVETISGTYEYIASTKTLSFKGLTWYSVETRKPSMVINGAHIIDSRTMEVIAQFPQEGETERVNFYKQ